MIPLVPLSFISCLYLGLLERPWRQRILASAPSLLFVLMIVSAFIVAAFLDRHSVTREGLETIILIVLPLAAIISMLFAFFYVKTWMNVLQLPNLFCGIFAFYIIAVGILA